MTESTHTSTEAVKSFVEAILKQSELLGSWSLAVFGACVLLVVWYAQKRMENHASVKLHWLVVVILAGALEGLSILAMYFAQGGLVNVIMKIQFQDFRTAKDFYDVLESTEFPHSQFLFAMQFAMFFAGILLVAAFAFKNFRLIGK